MGIPLKDCMCHSKDSNVEASVAKLGARMEERMFGNWGEMRSCCSQLEGGGRGEGWVKGEGGSVEEQKAKLPSSGLEHICSDLVRRKPGIQDPRS